MLPKLRNWPEHPLYAATASAKGKASRRSRRLAARRSSAHCRNGTSPISIRRPDAPKLKADLETSERAADAMQERYAGKLAALLDGGKGGAALAQAVREFEALERPARPHRLLCEPALCRRHLRPQAAEILRRHPGEDHRDLLQAPVLPARAEPARRRACSRRRWPIPELGHYRPWLEDLRKEKPLSARGQARAAVPREGGDRRAAPGTGCSTRP